MDYCYATRRSEYVDSMLTIVRYGEIIERNPDLVPKHKIRTVHRELSDLVIPGHYAGTLKSGVRVFGIKQMREDPTVLDFQVEYESLAEDGERYYMPVELFLINYRIIVSDMM